MSVRAGTADIPVSRACSGSVRLSGPPGPVSHSGRGFASHGLHGARSMRVAPNPRPLGAEMCGPPVSMVLLMIAASDAVTMAASLADSSSVRSCSGISTRQIDGAGDPTCGFGQRRRIGSESDLGPIRPLGDRLASPHRAPPRHVAARRSLFVRCCRYRWAEFFYRAGTNGSLLRWRASGGGPHAKGWGHVRIEPVQNFDRPLAGGALPRGRQDRLAKSRGSSAHSLRRN